MCICQDFCNTLCTPVQMNTSFCAQFGVNSNPSSGSDIPFFTVFNIGKQITANNTGVITLSAGFIYHIDYLFLATPEIGSYFQIVPHINHSPALLYSALSQAAVYRSVSASGSFLTNQALNDAATLRFVLTYPEETVNIDISGAVSIMPALSAENILKKQ